MRVNCALSAVSKSHQKLISEITCHEISMMELTNGIGFKPRYFVTEVSVEHVEAGLWQRPCVADVHLQREKHREKFPKLHNFPELFEVGNCRKC